MLTLKDVKKAYGNKATFFGLLKVGDTYLPYSIWANPCIFESDKQQNIRVKTSYNHYNLILGCRCLNTIEDSEIVIAYGVRQ